MGNLTQRWVPRLRNAGETWLLRFTQWLSVFLGRFTPRAQTRIVRATQITVLVHGKSTDDDVSTQAAALTYATLLSLLPMLMLGLSVSGYLIGTATRPEWYDNVLKAVPGLSTVITPATSEQLLGESVGIGLFGLIALLWAASVLSSRAERSMAIVFGQRKRAITNRFRALAVTLGLGTALIATIVAGAVLEGLNFHGLIGAIRLVYQAGILLLEFGYFFLAYWLLTPGTEIRARDHLPGTVVLTAGFFVLKVVGGLIFSYTVKRSQDLYGAIGAVFGLLLIIRLGMWLFLYGAELSSILRAERLSRSSPAPA